MSDNVTIKALKYNQKLKKLLVKGNKNYNFQKIKYECLDSIKSLQYLDEEKIIRTGVFRVDEISKEPSKLFVSVNAKETKKQ